MEFKRASIEFLDAKLQNIFDEYNLDHTEPFEKREFAFALEEDGEIIGGITAYSGFDWFYISTLAIEKKFRGQGYAVELVKRAEEEAKKRKCKGVWLHMISFQAPDFYKKLGYEEFGRLEDCPKGHQRIYLRKNLNAEN